MLGKALAVAVLAASTVVAGLGPSLASSKAGRTGPADGKAGLAGEVSPWSQTDSDAAASRANPAEHVLSPSAVTKVKYLRSVVAPVIPPRAFCGTSMVAPALAGGDLYVITNARLSKYDAATGKLIWRRTPDPSFDTGYESLSVSDGLVVVSGPGCASASQPGGSVYAYNASTGAHVWSRVFGNEVYQTVVDNGYVVAEGADAAGNYAYVLNLSTGRTAWRRTTCFGPSSLPVPLVVDNLVMSTDCNNKGNPVIEADNLATGAVAWSLHGTWRFQRGDLSGQQVYATNPAGTVVALDPQTGTVEYSLKQAVKVLAVDSSRAYSICRHRGEDVCAYNVSTGALEWRDTQLAGTPRIAAEADDVLYLDFGAALNAATGHFIKTIWVPQSNRRLANAIAVGDGLIAVAPEPRVLDLFGLPGS